MKEEAYMEACMSERIYGNLEEYMREGVYICSRERMIMYGA